MKKLSKLHLRNEQYLTNAEMKLISGGETYSEKPTCSGYTTEETCKAQTKCYILIDLNRHKEGECKFGYMMTGAQSKACYCYG